MEKKTNWNKENKFKKIYIREMQEYFDIEANFLEKIETATKKELKEYASNLPTLQGFLSKIKIDRDTFNLWLKEAGDDSYFGDDKKGKIELFNVFKKCMEISESIWINNSLKGLYSPSFAVFVGKNIFGRKDKAELIENSTNDINKSRKEYLEKLKSKVEKMTNEEIDRTIIEVLEG